MHYHKAIDVLNHFITILLHSEIINVYITILSIIDNIFDKLYNYYCN